MSSGYSDLRTESERQLEDRQYNRRRLLSGIRGNIRRHSHPKVLASLALCVSLILGAIVGYIAYRIGLSPWGPAPALGVLAAWPAYVLLCYRIAVYLFQKIKLESDFSTHVSFDRFCEGLELQRALDANEAFPDTFEDVVHTAVRGGPSTLGILVFMGILTFGFWFVKLLICDAINIFAEIIADDLLERKYPGFSNHFAVESWVENAFLSPAPYFIVLIGMALVLGPVAWIPLHDLSWVSELSK